MVGLCPWEKCSMVDISLRDGWFDKNDMPSGRISLQGMVVLIDLNRMMK